MPGAATIAGCPERRPRPQSCWGGWHAVVYPTRIHIDTSWGCTRRRTVPLSHCGVLSHSPKNTGHVEPTTRNPPNSRQSFCKAHFRVSINPARVLLRATFPTHRGAPRRILGACVAVIVTLVHLLSQTDARACATTPHEEPFSRHLRRPRHCSHCSHCSLGPRALCPCGIRDAR